jgi:hypothetical protein
MVRNCWVAWESENKGGEATYKKLLPCSIYIITISSALDTKIYDINLFKSIVYTAKVLFL